MECIQADPKFTSAEMAVFGNTVELRNLLAFLGKIHAHLIPHNLPSVFKEYHHLSVKVGVPLLPRTLHVAMPLKLWIVLMKFENKAQSNVYLD